MINPKACPFCGGAAETDYMQPFRTYQSGELLNQPAVYCTVCCAQISYYMKDLGLDRDDTMSLVLEAWNNRTPDPAIDALQAEIERLRALVIQYRDDLRRPPTGDSLERRLSAISQALEASHER